MSYDPRHTETATELVALAELDAATFSDLLRLNAEQIDKVIATRPTATCCAERKNAAIAIATFAWTAAAWYREICKNGRAYFSLRHRYNN